MWGQDLTVFDLSHEAFLRSTFVENSLESEQESDNHRLIFQSGGSGALNLEIAVGNIQSFPHRTQRTAEKHREDQEKMGIHDD
jgi:hypothetical protein